MEPRCYGWVAGELNTPGPHVGAAVVRVGDVPVPKNACPSWPVMKRLPPVGVPRRKRGHRARLPLAGQNHRRGSNISGFPKGRRPHTVTN